ncbi:hypothetical protein [Streptomyces sp. URMC 123]|uniref:hypothetical protein n=1 Tax=Streptomyces sp. URMC 123 TaxID=3423403 RepID=UPI003F1C79C6
MRHYRSALRLVRAALFAAVAVVLAGAGHALMSGGHIPLAGLLAAFAVTGAVAWAAAGKQRGPVAIATGLVAVQGALHLIFAGARSWP